MMLVPAATLVLISSAWAQGLRAVPDYVTRYAPLVWLHSEDPFRPSDLLQHIQHTTPTVDQKPIPGLPPLDLDNLAVLNDAVSEGEVALTANGDVTAMPSWLLGETPDESGRIANSTPAVVILVDKSPTDVDAFFFYFYSYDRGGNISQVLEPISGMLPKSNRSLYFGNHVGDWEHNMVRFRDGKPTGIWYSQHAYGAAYDWDDAHLSMKDERPLVFSAYGSHANYPSAGDQVHDYALLDFCDAGKIWDPVLSAYFYQFDPTTSKLTRLSTPGDATLPAASNLTSFLYFDGLWGDVQYPDDDPRQMTLPRFGLRRFTSGPRGPMVKHLVRKGVRPDKRPPVTWLEWAVGIMMALYPCCLRGWRVWVSGTIVVVFLVLVAVGITCIVRRNKRRKGYKQVETDIPLDDLESEGGRKTRKEL